MCLNNKVLIQCAIVKAKLAYLLTNIQTQGNFKCFIGAQEYIKMKHQEYEYGQDIKL